MNDDRYLSDLQLNPIKWWADDRTEKTYHVRKYSVNFAVIHSLSGIDDVCDGIFDRNPYRIIIIGVNNPSNNLWRRFYKVTVAVDLSLFFYCIFFFFSPETDRRLVIIRSVLTVFIG